jgi:hypothetical protein
MQFRAQSLKPSGIRLYFHDSLVTNAIGIGLLLSGLLDFGVDTGSVELPAFSVACALAAQTTTSVYFVFS